MGAFCLCSSSPALFFSFPNYSHHTYARLQRPEKKNSRRIPINMTTNPVDDYEQKPNVKANPVTHSGANSDTARPENEAYNPERDQRDMRRLGKRQELKVRSYKCKILGDLTDWPSKAPLPLLQHRRLHHRAGSHLGVFHCHFSVFFGQWRYCRCDMACSRRHFWHVHRHVVNGGNGQHGTDIWRSIPLGFGICACKVSEAAIICCGLARVSWLAICYADSRLCRCTADTRLDFCLPVW